MKVWKVTEGDPNLFNGAPEWATQIASSGDSITYEERLGKIGGKWQRTDSECVHIYEESNSINGWEVIARRKLVDENQKPKRKRKKGPKLTARTTSRVFVRYNDDTTYTIKNPISLRVENGFTIVVIEQKESLDGAVVETKDVYIKNDSINLITIVAEHFISLLKYNGDLGTVTEIANGNMKVISKAEFNISPLK